MSDEDKASREKRKALIYDAAVLVLAGALAIQTVVPAVIPLVHALKGSETPPAQMQVAQKAAAK